jgi:hypothetical protein
MGIEDLYYPSFARCLVHALFSFRSPYALDEIYYILVITNTVI